MRNNKGFSLVELMVVVAIIGILAAIAVPNFQKFAAKSKQSEAKSNLAALYSAERAFFSEWQIFYGDFSAVSYAPTGQLRYRHGFASAGSAAIPLNFSMPAAQIKGYFSTQQYCPSTAIGTAGYCAEITTPVAPTLPGGSLASANQFVATAGGDLTGGAVGQDQWSVDQSKNMLNTTVGY